MPNRANSFERKIEILQFTLLASEEKKVGRNVFFAINSHLFDKEWQWTTDYGIEGGEKDVRTRIEKPPGRKIFRTYVQDLVDEKLLVKIHTNDDRANWYSITPLGICQLIKSEEFFDGIKLRWPENYFVILTLMTFASQNVKPYGSIIFGKEKFIDRETNLWEDLGKIDMSIREELPHILSNIEIKNNAFSFYVTNGFHEENKLPLTRGNFGHKRYDEDSNVIQENLIQLIELNKKIDVPILGDLDYTPLLLDEKQFHHYFANLIICSLIYYNTIARFDIDRRISLRHMGKGKSPKKETMKEFLEEWKKYPEYFQRIVALFSNHATKIASEQTNLMNDFSVVLR